MRIGAGSACLFSEARGVVLSRFENFRRLYFAITAILFGLALRHNSSDGFAKFTATRLGGFHGPISLRFSSYSARSISPRAERIRN